MVNIQLPISHKIAPALTSSNKIQMSSEASQDSPTKSLIITPKVEQLNERFMKGSVIQLGNGETKKVEDLQTEDFIKSAAFSSHLSLEHSKLTRLGNIKSISRVNFANFPTFLPRLIQLIKIETLLRFHKHGQ